MQLSPIRSDWDRGIRVTENIEWLQRSGIHLQLRVNVELSAVEAEQRLHYAYDTAWLDLAFRRPRVGVARRAVMHVAAELVDAGRIPAASIEDLADVCVFFDVGLESMKPSQRDSSIRRTPAIQGKASSDWVSVAAADFAALQTNTLDGHVILAEFTRLKNLDWGRAIEVREASLLAVQVVPPSDEHVSLFSRVTLTRIGGYPHVTPDEANSLVIRNWVVYSDTLGAEWIAFNPNLAHALGWKLSSSGLFRWLDSEGRPTVETVWWQDGPFEREPPHLYNEVGYGWQVIATDIALTQIREHFGTLWRIVRLSRETSDGGRRTGFFSQADIQPYPWMNALEVVPGVPGLRVPSRVSKGCRGPQTTSASGGVTSGGASYSTDIIGLGRAALIW
jgi:hypothetical protein